MDGELVTIPSENQPGESEGTGVVFGCSSQAIIVVPEWWGMSDEVEDLGGMISEASGLMVLIMDFYHGHGENNNEEADRYEPEHVDWGAAIRLIQSGVDYLKTSRGCSSVGIVGFGSGGALAMLAALRSSVDAAASFYGIPSPEHGDITRIRTPLQVHFGKRDVTAGAAPMKFIPLREKLRACRVPIDFHDYDAAHSFADSKSPNYSTSASELALGRMYEFMQNNMK